MNMIKGKHSHTDFPKIYVIFLIEIKDFVCFA